MTVLDHIKRKRLEQRGLSSGKKRRSRNNKTLSSYLEQNFLLRLTTYLLFVIVGTAIITGAPSSTPLNQLKGWFSTAVILISSVLVLSYNTLKIAKSNKVTSLVLGGILLQILLLRLSLTIHPQGHLLILPFAFAPMIHSILLGQRMGTYTTFFSSLIGAFIVPHSLILEYIILSFVCGYISVLITRQVRNRRHILKAGFYVGLITAFLAALMKLTQQSELFNSNNFTWISFGTEIAILFTMGLCTGLVVGGLLPFLEQIFSITTDISWLEMSDLNHPLLRRMQLEAPGTFHHSLVVASLSETAAEAIGAHAIMCRVGAYFHDIGKLPKPEYFIENQFETNPHDTLTPTMSSLIIIAHVKDGVDLALKEKLNSRIIEVIEEHHGTSLVAYFYRKAQEQQQDIKEKVSENLANPEDLPEIDQKNFRYPGPLPSTRESGIISLADTVESASRSLAKPTPAKIETLVEELIYKRLKEGQLDDCNLTIQELTQIKEAFTKTLRSMMHNRISYPKDHEKEKHTTPTDTHNEKTNEKDSTVSN